MRKEQVRNERWVGNQEMFKNILNRVKREKKRRITSENK